MSNPKFILFCILPLLFGVAVLEVGTRVVASFFNQSTNPLFYGFTELHRFFLEDADQIIKKQGTFHKKLPGKAIKSDSLGREIRNQYHSFKHSGPRIAVIGESAVYSVTTSAEHSMPHMGIS